MRQCNCVWREYFFSRMNLATKISFKQQFVTIFHFSIDIFNAFLLHCLQCNFTPFYPDTSGYMDGVFLVLWNLVEDMRDSGLQINQVHGSSSNVKITGDVCLQRCLKENIKSGFQDLPLPVGDSERLLLDFLPLRVRNLSLTFFASSNNSRFFFLSSSDILTSGSGSFTRSIT